MIRLRKPYIAVLIIVALIASTLTLNRTYAAIPSDVSEEASSEEVYRNEDRPTFDELSNVLEENDSEVEGSDNNRYVGWYQESNGKWRYYYSDGTYAIGWKMIDEKWYYFNSSGYMHTGWLLYNANWYYLASTGIMVTG